MGVIKDCGNPDCSICYPKLKFTPAQTPFNVGLTMTTKENDMGNTTVSIDKDTQRFMMNSPRYDVNDKVTVSIDGKFVTGTITAITSEPKIFKDCTTISFRMINANWYYNIKSNSGDLLNKVREDKISKFNQNNYFDFLVKQGIVLDKNLYEVVSFEQNTLVSTAGSTYSFGFTYYSITPTISSNWNMRVRNVNTGAYSSFNGVSDGMVPLAPIPEKKC
jgi:hypothetical protein